MFVERFSISAFGHQKDAGWCKLELRLKGGDFFGVGSTGGHKFKSSFRRIGEPLQGGGTEARRTEARRERHARVGQLGRYVITRRVQVQVVFRRPRASVLGMPILGT